MANVIRFQTLETQMKTKRLLSICALAASVCMAIIAVLYFAIDRPASMNPMLVSVTKVHVGYNADEADAAMGMLPVSITDADGYLMGPMVMLTPENELAPKDQVEPFSLRKYTNDGHHYAVVALRTDGRVAGKWAWRDSDPRITKP